MQGCHLERGIALLPLSRLRRRTCARAGHARVRRGGRLRARGCACAQRCTARGPGLLHLGLNRHPATSTHLLPATQPEAAPPNGLSDCLTMSDAWYMAHGW